MSFADAIKQAEREGQVGTGVWKPQEGANRIRVVAGPLPHPETYKGEKRFKWLTFVLDRADGMVKPYFMPHSVAKLLRDLQQSEDYAFEGTPLPYDITLNAKGAGTRDVEYSVVPARKSTPLTKAEEDKIAEKGSIAAFQAKLREKQGEPEERPFDPDEQGGPPL